MHCSLFTFHSLQYVWIGLSDIEREGTFRWEVDNSTVGFANWESGQPNNFDEQDCVTLGAREFFGLWNDYECRMALLYVCEEPATGKSKHFKPFFFKQENATSCWEEFFTMGKAVQFNINP